MNVHRTRSEARGDVAKGLRVEYLPPGDLRSDPRNPRLHSPNHIAALARSIETFGFNVPVLSDENNGIIAGHGRVAAAVKKGLEVIPVIRIDHLSPEQRQAFMIAENRLSELSTWSEPLLAEILRDLTVAEIDFDLDAIGFSVGEIDFRIEGVGDDAGEAEDKLVPVADEAVSVEGDIWQLGRHRLMCASALDAVAWQLLMDGATAAMGLTDPPYNVRINGHVSGLGKVQHREFRMASGELDRDEFTDFLRSTFTLMAKHSVPGSIHFTAMDWRHVPEMIAAGEAAFTELKNICVWSKHVGSMGSLYRSQHELFFVWKSGRARHRNNVALGKNGRNRTNVWSYPGINGFRHGDEGDLLKLHSTVKPVKLLADAILDVSARGDIVLDPFLGSGSTIMAAERVGRIAYGFEIDPLYVDTILRRYEAHTGDRAVHVATGSTFAEIVEQRAANAGEQIP